MTKINRREALTRMGGFMALGLVAPKIFAQSTSNIVSPAPTIVGGIPSDTPFSIAHITDVHITYQRQSEQWVSTGLNAINAHPLKPSLILNTGDCIMDSNRVDRMESDKLWKVWNTTFKRENSLPMYTCLGNHDIFGLHLPKDHQANKDPLYGKKLSLDKLGMDRLYYSFDKGAWHFVMLDGVLSTGRGKWRGQIDDEQFHWLEADLKDTSSDRPVIICTHIPIIQMCSLPSIKPDKNGGYDFGPTTMMADARRLVDLFKRHPNVKLCYSGHIHRLDNLELSGTSYICDGAMSGSKWLNLGSHIAAPGYSITTLNPDGTFEYKYETFGWKLKA